MCGLTFELSGRRRQGAKPGLVKMYEYHQPGLGGLPLVLRLSEGLGVTAPAEILQLVPEYRLNTQRLNQTL